MRSNCGVKIAICMEKCVNSVTMIDRMNGNNCIMSGVFNLWISGFTYYDERIIAVDK